MRITTFILINIVFVIYFKVGIPIDLKPILFTSLEVIAIMIILLHELILSELKDYESHNLEVTRLQDQFKPDTNVVTLRKPDGTYPEPIEKKPSQIDRLEKVYVKVSTLYTKINSFFSEILAKGFNIPKSPEPECSLNMIIDGTDYSIPKIPEKSLLRRPLLFIGYYLLLFSFILQLVYFADSYLILKNKESSQSIVNDVTTDEENIINEGDIHNFEGNKNSKH